MFFLFLHGTEAALSDHGKVKDTPADLLVRRGVLIAEKSQLGGIAAGAVHFHDAFHTAAYHALYGLLGVECHVLVVMSTWYFAAAAEKAASSSLRTS